MLENLKKYNVLLASGSPRRRELMEMLDIDFSVIRCQNVEEVWPDSLMLDDVPAYLARLKANAYQGKVADNALIISADTVVICDDRIIGKPCDLDDARRMLRLLSGKTHRVVTGVCVTAGNRTEVFSATTFVTFATISDEEIDEYVTRYRPLDKAGAYGIQELIGAIAVNRIDGSYYNVMGLPVHRLYALLKTF